jgi:hypothetical protein
MIDKKEAHEAREKKASASKLIRKVEWLLKAPELTVDKARDLDWARNSKEGENLISAMFMLGFLASDRDIARFKGVYGKDPPVREGERWCRREQGRAGKGLGGAGKSSRMTFGRY